MLIVAVIPAPFLMMMLTALRRRSVMAPGMRRRSGVIFMPLMPVLVHLDMMKFGSVFLAVPDAVGRWRWQRMPGRLALEAPAPIAVAAVERITASAVIVMR